MTILETISTNAAYVAGFILLVIFLFAYIWASRYIKVGPNEVLVISGRKRKILNPDGTTRVIGYRLVHGGGAFVIPVIEQAQIMSMELITLDFKTPPVITLHGVPVLVDGVAQIKVKSDEISIGTAAEQFLSKSQTEIMRIAHQTLEGHLRAILGTMTVEDIYKNRDEFAIKVQQVSATDLSNMGLCIVSFTLRDIKDEHGYLESLGKTRIAEVKKAAAIGEAIAKKDATIGEANAQKESTIQSSIAAQEGEIAKIAARTKIAEANRDSEMKMADYQSSVNQRKAEMDLAYDLEYNKKQQLVKREEMNIQIVEKERAIELQEKEALRKQQELDALVIKPAEAEKQKVQMAADAEKYKISATASGEADAQKMIGLARAEAEKARGMAEVDVAKARGITEAEVIKAKGYAEAESMAKKADSWRQYGEAAVVNMVMEKLPEIARSVSEPLSKTEKIVMISNGGDPGASKITGDVINMVAQLPPAVEALTGVKLENIIKKYAGDKKDEKPAPEKK